MVKDLILISEAVSWHLSDNPNLEVILCVLYIEVAIVAILGNVLFFDKVLQLRESLIWEGPWEPVTRVILHDKRVRAMFEECVNVKEFPEVVFGAMQVNRWKVELGGPPLCIQLSFVAELHVEDWTGNADEKLRHGE